MTLLLAGAEQFNEQESPTQTREIFSGAITAFEGTLQSIAGMVVDKYNLLKENISVRLESIKESLLMISGHFLEKAQKLRDVIAGVPETVLKNARSIEVNSTRVVLRATLITVLAASLCACWGRTVTASPTQQYPRLAAHTADIVCEFDELGPGTLAVIRLGDNSRLISQYAQNGPVTLTYDGKNGEATVTFDGENTTMAGHNEGLSFLDYGRASTDQVFEFTYLDASGAPVTASIPASDCTGIHIDWSKR